MVKRILLVVMLSMFFFSGSQVESLKAEAADHWVYTIDDQDVYVRDSSIRGNFHTFSVDVINVNKEDNTIAGIYHRTYKQSDGTWIFKDERMHKWVTLNINDHHANAIIQYVMDYLSSK